MEFVGYMFGILAVITGIAVIALRNPIYSALALVSNLLLVAGMYATMEAHFIAIAQIVLYAGAVMVLVVFVLMLLNIKQENKRSIGLPGLICSVVAGVVFVTTIVPIILANTAQIPDVTRADAALYSIGDTKSIGIELFTKYSVPFEVTSALLMVGIVGAIMMAKRRSPKA